MPIKDIQDRYSSDKYSADKYSIDKYSTSKYDTVIESTSYRPSNRYRSASENIGSRYGSSRTVEEDVSKNIADLNISSRPSRRATTTRDYESSAAPSPSSGRFSTSSPVYQTPSTSSSSRYASTSSKYTTDGKNNPDYSPKPKSISNNHESVGLRNLGNTCFMNSIIQCLINTKPLRDFFNDSSYTKKLKTRSGVASAFADLLEEFNSARSSSYVSPASLKRQVEKRASQFSGYSQHDSQELLLFLLDGIHEDMNHCNRSAHKYVELDKLPFLEQASESWRQYTLRDFSPIVEIFVGQIVSTLTCLSCDEQSTVFESFWDLSVPLGSTVESCLKKFTTEETLDGADKPMCDNCKKQRKMRKVYKMWKLPEVLIIHLKRFKQSGRSRNKDSSRVRLDEKLNVSQFLHDKSRGNSGTTYELFAVSNHMGDTGGGHYTASCKNEGGESWRYCNDMRVSNVSSNEVQSSDAYVLFYQRL